MQITERPPKPLDLPCGEIVHIATQPWALEVWVGDADPSKLMKI